MRSAPPPRTFRVSPRDLAELERRCAAAFLPNPLIRVVPLDGALRSSIERKLQRTFPADWVLETRALQVRMRSGQFLDPFADYEFVELSESARAPTAAETQAFEQTRSPAARAAAQVAPPIETDPFEAPALKAMVKTAQRAEETAVCGAPSGRATRQCTDAEEQQCLWAPPGTELPDTPMRRALARFPSCPRRAVAEQELRVRRAARARAARTTGVPAEIINLLGNPDHVPEKRPALEVTRRWDADQAHKPILVLSGPKRCGKTYAAASCLLSKSAGIFVSATVLHLAGLPGGDTGLARSVSGAAFVVLDDLGSDLSEITRGAIEGILLGVTARAGGAVVITTRLDREALLAVLRTVADHETKASRRVELYATFERLEMEHP